MPTNSPTTITSSDGSHSAALTPSPDGDGVWVVIKRVYPPMTNHRGMVPALPLPPGVRSGAQPSCTHSRSPMS